MLNITYTFAKTGQDLQQILDLQKLNLPKSISKEELAEQGFVTVNHSFDLLKYMNQPYPHAIAKVDGEVMAYALVMLRNLENKIPVLIPMFKKINKIQYKAVLLKNTKYFIMGQVCVAKAFRGQGVFAGLYQQLKKQMSQQFDYMITEVATRNHRSIRAHKKIGFQNILEYSAEEECWAILLWDWKGG